MEAQKVLLHQLWTFNCFFQGKFLFENEKDKDRAKKWGSKTLKKTYELNEIISGDWLRFLLQV